MHLLGGLFNTMATEVEIVNGLLDRDLFMSAVGTRTEVIGIGPEITIEPPFQDICFFLGNCAADKDFKLLKTKRLAHGRMYTHLWTTSNL